MNYEKLRKLSDLKQQDELLAQARLEVQRQIDLAQMDLDFGSYFDSNFGIFFFFSPFRFPSRFKWSEFKIGKYQIKVHTFIPLSILRERRGGARQ